MPELIGVGELSRRVNLHINTIRKLADRSEIPSVRTPGGQRRFELIAVQNALAIRNRSPKFQSTMARALSVPGKKWHKVFPISGLSEDVVWQELAKDLNLNMAETCADIFPYAFTGMLNNAIEHSRGSEVDVTFVEGDECWNFLIQDDGDGAFQNMAKNFHLSSSLEAVAELTKGKRTTAPRAHTGEGIFFTSKAVDIFEIEANGLAWKVDNLRTDFAVGKAERTIGTSVFCSLSRITSRTLISVFQRFTKDHVFTRSRPVIKLFETGMMFLSRSEARRLVVGLDKFSEVELDFAEVNSVGQGFVDEIFRVWRSAHLGTQLFPVNMNPSVEFMVLRSGTQGDEE